MCFQCHDVSPSFVMCCCFVVFFFFGDITSSDIVILFTTTLLTYVDNFDFTKSSGYKPRVSPMEVVSTFPWVTISSVILLKFQSNLTFIIITFVAPSSFLANSILWLPIFIQCYVGLSLGDNEVTHLHALLSVHELNNRWRVT